MICQISLFYFLFFWGVEVGANLYKFYFKLYNMFNRLHKNINYWKYE